MQKQTHVVMQSDMSEPKLGKINEGYKTETARTKTGQAHFKVQKPRRQNFETANIEGYEKQSTLFLESLPNYDFLVLLYSK